MIVGQFLKLAAKHDAAARLNEWLLALMLAQPSSRISRSAVQNTYQKFSRFARPLSINAEGQMRVSFESGSTACA